MRRRIGGAVSQAWWQFLGLFGLDKARWRKQPRATQRAVKAVVWVGIGLLLVVAGGVWEWSALVIAAVVLLLVVPDYGRITIGGRRVGRYIVPVAALAIAVAYPYYASSNGAVNPGLPQLPIFGPFPQMSTMVGMAVFAMMALGLNFVVGYAGLLDLGYVAFYAMGSYMAGWFASSQFGHQNVFFGAI